MGWGFAAGIWQLDLEGRLQCQWRMQGGMPPSALPHGWCCHPPSAHAHDGAAGIGVGTVTGNMSVFAALQGGAHTLLAELKQQGAGLLPIGEREAPPPACIPTL